MRTEIARLQKRLGTTTIYVTHDQTEAMTLGDRVAVLNHGVIQQLGTPYELYEQPRNLFVAAFIGSPAMNFFPAQIHDDRLFLPLLDLETLLPEHANLSRGVEHVIAGLRPEHIHALTDSKQPDNLHIVFDITVDVVEWLGAEHLIYFQKAINHWPNSPVLTRDVNLQKQPGDELDFAARLSSTYTVKENDALQLCFDPNKLHLFDPDSGICLTSPQH
jgi:multiple sugar transport system ATP-binding protein